MTALKVSHIRRQSSRTGIPPGLRTLARSGAAAAAAESATSQEDTCAFNPLHPKTPHRGGPMRGRALRCALFYSWIVKLADYRLPFAQPRHEPDSRALRQ